MGRALSLALIYIPSSLHSGYHGSKELDSNSATVGWNLSQEERDDHIFVWVRQGVDGRSLTCTLLHCFLLLQPHVRYYIHIIIRQQLTSIMSVFIGRIWIHKDVFVLWVYWIESEIIGPQRAVPTNMWLFVCAALLYVRWLVHVLPVLAKYLVTAKKKKTHSKLIYFLLVSYLCPYIICRDLHISARSHSQASINRTTLHVFLNL